MQYSVRSNFVHPQSVSVCFMFTFKCHEVLLWGLKCKENTRKQRRER